MLFTALSLLLFFACSKEEIESEYTFVRLPYLKAGDLVGIISPVAKISAASDTATVRQRFEKLGLRVKFGASLLNRDEPYFSGTDEEKIADLHAMIDDKEVKAIVAYRGGYGSVCLLDLVDFSKLRYSPKWVVEYSDVTMLHLALYKQGVGSIHGTCPYHSSMIRTMHQHRLCVRRYFGKHQPCTSLHVPSTNLEKQPDYW